MTTKLDGLVKRDAILRSIKSNIEGKAWRDTAEKEALAWLQKSEKNRKADVVAFVKAEYDAAGAGWNGRWQG